MGILEGFLGALAPKMPPRAPKTPPGGLPDTPGGLPEAPLRRPRGLPEAQILDIVVVTCYASTRARRNARSD